MPETNNRKADGDLLHSADAIFRAERGRMRNEWYPRKMAEYMTAARFRELGLPRTAIGERDATFGTLDAADLRDAAAAAAAASTQPTAPAAAPKPLSATVCYVPKSLSVPILLHTCFPGARR